LEISAEEPVAAQLPSQMYETGFACTSDGSVVVNSVPPLDQSKRRGAWILNTISPSGKVVSFDFKKNKRYCPEGRPGCERARCGGP
jgi:hypothetical protein